MKLFRTNIIIDILQEAKISLDDFGGCKFVLKPEPSLCYWQSNDGRSQTMFSAPPESKDIREDLVPQNELLIEAETEEMADDVLSIIHGGLQLAYPEPSLKSDLFYVTEYKPEHEEFYRKPPFRNRFRKLENLDFGCIITQSLYKDRQAIYAIEKYKTSLELASFRPHSIDPRYGQYFEHYDIKRQFHTKAAIAIISAFSVIEELGLEVRSSAKKPRFLDVKSGEWNPIVLDNINRRLSEANIEATETFDWVYRGDETRIEQEIKPFFGYDSEWTKYGTEVRDKTLTYPEAIHNSSYLRNYISAHKFNELTQYFSPYDVYNVQALARKVILLKYGFWKTLFER